MTPVSRPASHTPGESTQSTLWYVYAVVPAKTVTGQAPPGIDAKPVELVQHGELAALTSKLDGESYSPNVVESNVGEVAWIAPRAQAHDDVVTWASQPGPVVPLHMWTLFGDRARVEEMLAQRGAKLQQLLDRVRDCDEYGLRVYADATAVQSSVIATDDRIAELKRSAEAAGPGQRYLIERKLEKETKDAARERARAVCEFVFDTLAEQSVDAARDAIPSEGGGAEARAVLSAAFLVKRDRFDAFRRVLTRLIGEQQDHGFRFDFTGPWPPYHFVGGSDS